MSFTKSFCLLTAVVLQLGSYSTAQDFLWAKTFGGTTAEIGKSALTDASGNVYTLGYFQGTADFNPGAATSNLTATGGYDMFITKLDANGNYLWAKKVGGTGNDISISLEMDAADNLYITGYYTGTVDFNPGAGAYSMTAGQAEDIFLLKLDSGGNFVWVRGFSEGSLDRGYSIAFDAAQNIYLCGSFAGTVDFDPGAGVVNLTASLYDSFILKLDAAGNYVWAKRFGAGYTDNTFDIAVDNNGYLYATGYYTTYTTDFDPGPAVASLPCSGADDAFVLKWDTDGNYVWARKLGSTEDDRGVSLCLDGTGNVYVAGYFSQTADFDPGLGLANITPYGIADIFIWKLDNSGNYIWSKRMGGTDNEIPTSITIDATGMLLTSGYFSGTVDFDPGTGIANRTSAGGLDGFLLKTGLNGNYSWIRPFGSTADDRISRIHTDAANNYYIAGDFQETVDFNPGTGVANTTSFGGRDAFVVKMGECIPSVHADTVSTCDAYTWNDSLYTISGDYTTALIAQNGCDSLLSLHLLINKTYDTLEAAVCDSYTLNGQTYTQSGAYEQVLTNTMGCDSILTLNLTIHESTAATLNVTACGSYLLNGQTYTQNGTYSQLLQNAAGCDSTLTLNLAIVNSSAAQMTITACDNYTLNGQTYAQSGSYNQVLTNAAGCDSLLTLDLTLLQSTSSSLAATACDNYTLNGQTYTQSGTYTQSLQNAAGCDSTITLSLTIHSSGTQTLPVTACDSYTLNGQTYTQSGTYVQNLSGVYGCDSTVILQLSLNLSDSGSEAVTTCDTYSWNGDDYTESGTYTALLTNQAGCDSTATLFLTIRNATTSTETVTACNEYTWNGTTYTTGGVYTALLTNNVGCDSVLTLVLTILESSEGSETVSACGSYTWNGSTYTIGGTYTASLTNSAGCDSTVTLQLTITNSPVVTATDNGNGSLAASFNETYQWIDCATNNPVAGAEGIVFWPAENGTYAVVGTTNGCSDTSMCVTIDNIGFNELSEQKPVVYPNPFHDKLTVFFPVPASAISIADVSGKQLLQREISSGESIDLAALIPGLYHLTIRTDYGIFTYLVVKE